MLALAQRLFLLLPPTLRQLASFAVVGVAGLIVDAAVLWLMTAGLGCGPYLGRIPAYIAAATVTWALNRHFTFRGLGTGSKLRQWLTFMLANLSGFAANYGTYAACVAFIPLVTRYPLLGLIPASIVGLFFNFAASKRLVFR